MHQIVEAGNLTAPFDAETAAVLPPKIRSPRFKFITMGIGDKFDNSGVSLPLGNTLNKTVTWQNLMDNPTNDSVDQQLIAGTAADSANANGRTFSLNNSPGKTVGDVKLNLNVQVPIFSMGLTDKWTVAVAVPVYRVSIDVATGFQRSEEGQQWINYTCGSNQLKCNETTQKLQDPINQKLTSHGYQPIRDENFSAVGDVKLIGKYQFSKTDNSAFAIKPFVTLPTGTRPNADKALDITTGDGQLDIGATVSWDRNIKGQFNFNSYSTYNIQLPDQLERRIPKSSDDPISLDKELVERDSGDQYAFGAGVSYGSPSGGLMASVGLSYQYMNSTSFKGTKFAPQRYEYLNGQFPLQDLYAANFTLAYATIDQFRQKEFLLPLQGALSYSRPLRGRNVTTNDVITAELVMFF